MEQGISSLKIRLRALSNLLKGRVRYSELGKIYDQARRADLILVDGDGDIVFSTPPRRQTLFLLAMIALGIRLQKRVAVVNTMLSDCAVTAKTGRLLLVRGLFLPNAGQSQSETRSLWNMRRRRCRRLECPAFPIPWFSGFLFIEITADEPAG